MARWLLPLVAVLAVALAIVTAAVRWTASSSAGSTRVVRVLDGDTVVVERGKRVRLLQIDAPELGSGECYSRRSARELRSLLPAGTRVDLETDPRLDAVDRFGRLLRYVFRGRLHVNATLVARGAATVWFYGGRRGEHAHGLLVAARGARKRKRGLWGACRAAWNPYGPARTRPRRVRHRRHGRCAASYPTVCIPPPPPDLDCRDVRFRGFRVAGRDPHHFDGDHDRVGCERRRAPSR